MERHFHWFPSRAHSAQELASASPCFMHPLSWRRSAAWRRPPCTPHRRRIVRRPINVPHEDALRMRVKRKVASVQAAPQAALRRVTTVISVCSIAFSTVFSFPLFSACPPPPRFGAACVLSSDMVAQPRMPGPLPSDPGLQPTHVGVKHSGPIFAAAHVLRHACAPMPRRAGHLRGAASAAAGASRAVSRAHRVTSPAAGDCVAKAPRPLSSDACRIIAQICDLAVESLGEPWCFRGIVSKAAGRQGGSCNIPYVCSQAWGLNSDTESFKACLCRTRWCPGTCCRCAFFAHLCAEPMWQYRCGGSPVEQASVEPVGVRTLVVTPAFFAHLCPEPLRRITGRASSCRTCRSPEISCRAAFFAHLCQEPMWRISGRTSLFRTCCRFLRALMRCTPLGRRYLGGWLQFLILGSSSVGMFELHVGLVCQLQCTNKRGTDWAAVVGAVRWDSFSGSRMLSAMGSMSYESSVSTDWMCAPSEALRDVWPDALLDQYGRDR